MNKQKLLVLGLVAVGIVLIGVVVFTAVQGLVFPTSEEAGVSFRTIESDRPEGSTCLNNPGEVGLAKELINIRENIVVVGGGTNPMPDAEWADYRPRLPWIKNINRNTLFSDSCFYRSPTAPVDCEGEACRIERDISGYSWVELSLVDAQDCVATGDAECTANGVDPGAVSITVTRKCHQIIFTDEIYELVDPAGNRYVMHAIDADTPDVNPTLPDGWTLARVALSEPLEILPFGGGDNCYHNVVRDHLGQGYHQYVFVDDQYPAP